MRISTKGNLPLFEPDYNPSGWWLMRPSWHRFVRSHVLCGDTGAGKTTLIYHGLHELSDAGIYDPDDLKMLARPKKTHIISRFSLERTAWINAVDSWIDVDGERFSRAFQPGGKKKATEKALERIYDRVNAMVMVVSAQQVLDLQRLDEKPGGGAAKMAEDFVSGFQQRFNELRPTLLKSLKRGGFKWHLVVSQCGDVSKPGKPQDTLIAALHHFAQRTGFRKVCRRAILCDSIPKASLGRGIQVSTLGVGPRGGLVVASSPSATICSAGIAMALILDRLKCTASEHDFIISL